MNSCYILPHLPNQPERIRDGAGHIFVDEEYRPMIFFMGPWLSFKEAVHRYRVSPYVAPIGKKFAVLY